MAEVGGSESFTVAGEEESGFLRQVVEERAGFGEEAVEPGGGALADWQHAVLAVLAFALDQGSGVGIIVAVIEIGHFGAPDAGGVEELQNCTVAQAEGVGGVGDGQQEPDFLPAEVFRKWAGLLARQVEIGGRIGGDDTGAAEPGEEAPDTTKPGERG